MTSVGQNRRDFLKQAAVVAAGGVPFWFGTSRSSAADFTGPNNRPVWGCIGTGDRWKEIAASVLRFADCAVICDVDSDHANEAREIVREQQDQRRIDVYGDYRKVLERKDVDVVTVVTPDHWHSKIAIEAMRAGKDVYCEKPLTLTIDEGKLIIKALNETKRVVQVGTQQRSEYRLRFLKAIAMIRDGRIGQIKRAVCNIGKAPKGGPFKKTAAPANLNWDRWLGQAPLVEYIAERCHYKFRFWYEYSGGKLTDWGAHHVDIAQWAIGMDHSGPTSVEPVHSVLPVPFKGGYPTVDNAFNTATEFKIRCLFDNNVEIVIQDEHDSNGILFEGTNGRIRVGRGLLQGQAVDELKTNPLQDEQITALYKGKKPGDHMRNFFECVKTREEPISDVYTHHRAITTCHLANIAMRLGRRLKWDARTEQIVGDEDARRWQAREQRRGYEIKA
jgi:predicted dehydrogenase